MRRKRGAHFVAGWNLCFAIPALRKCTSSRPSSVEGMRCVLGLFEGVVTGAAATAGAACRLD
jgi:hypothetical protein